LYISGNAVAHIDQPKCAQVPDSFPRHGAADPKGGMHNDKRVFSTASGILGSKWIGYDRTFIAQRYDRLTGSICSFVHRVFAKAQLNPCG
jgi:hypothetical protein